MRWFVANREPRELSAQVYSIEVNHTKILLTQEIQEDPIISVLANFKSYSSTYKKMVLVIYEFHELFLMCKD